MRFFTHLVGIATLVAGIKGHETTGTAEEKTGTTTASAAAKTHTISVGAEGHQFTPKELEAEVGDILEYRFYPTTHSVSRAEFRYPCIPYEMSGPGKVGFWSGYQTLNVLPSEGGPKFQVRVNDTAPIFYYCSAPGSCIDNNMIGVINPNKTYSLDNQVKFIANTTLPQLAPGDSFPEETASGGGLPDPTATSSSDSQSNGGSGGNSGNSGSSGSSGDDSGKLSAGAIAGIAIGAAAVLILAGALVYLFGRRGGFNMAHRNSAPMAHGYPPAAAEAKYPLPPSSPGQSTFYSDAYRSQTGSPPPVSHQTSPSLGGQQYAPFPGMAPAAGSAFLTAEGAYDPRAAKPAATATPPVELPANGAAPAQGYGQQQQQQQQQQQRYSWSRDESAYRPEPK